MDQPSRVNQPIPKQFPQPVYFVSCPQDDTVLVAIHPSITDNYISWFDTVKERIMKIGEIITDQSDLFIFIRADYEGNYRYEFRPMTLAIYQEKVKSKLNNAQDITTEAELIAGFEKTLENAW